MHFMDDSFVNLGDKVILTLLWQSGPSESGTVCFVISLSICWLFKWVLRIVCVCVCVCVCMCMCVRERESHSCSVMCVCLCVHSLCANTYKLNHCVCHSTQLSFRGWTDGKTKDIINCLYFSFESWSSRLWKGELHLRCGLWCSANLRADCVCRKERLCRKLSIWERWGIEDLQ